MQSNIKDIQITVDKLCEEAEFKINSKTIVEETKTIFIKNNLVDRICLNIIIDKESVAFRIS